MKYGLTITSYADKDFTRREGEVFAIRPESDVEAVNLGRVLLLKKETKKGKTKIAEFLAE